jgi:hypothetical protein
MRRGVLDASMIDGLSWVPNFSFSSASGSSEGVRGLRAPRQHL